MGELEHAPPDKLGVVHIPVIRDIIVTNQIHRHPNQGFSWGEFLTLGDKRNPVPLIHKDCHENNAPNLADLMDKIS